jgi:hypothetical protein
MSTFTKIVAFTVPSFTKLAVTQVKFGAWTLPVPSIVQMGRKMLKIRKFHAHLKCNNYEIYY